MSALTSDWFYRYQRRCTRQSLITQAMLFFKGHCPERSRKLDDAQRAAGRAGLCDVAVAIYRSHMAQALWYARPKMPFDMRMQIRAMVLSSRPDDFVPRVRRKTRPRVAGRCPR